MIAKDEYKSFFEEAEYLSASLHASIEFDDDRGCFIMVLTDDQLREIREMAVELEDAQA